jgi:hypothetical protein
MRRKLLTRSNLLLLSLSLALIIAGASLLSVAEIVIIYNVSEYLLHPSQNLSGPNPNFANPITVKYVHPYEWAYSILFLGVFLFLFEAVRYFRLRGVSGQHR